MLCIYHNQDLDGFASGAVVKHKYPEARFYGYNYGDKFDIEAIKEGEIVIMVDVSMPMDVMKQIGDKCGFTWIDHHVSANKDFTEFQKDKKDADKIKVNYQYRLGIGACQVAWQHLNPHSLLPYTIKMLSMYDTWQNTDQVLWNSEILPFQYSMRTLVKDPLDWQDWMFDKGIGDKHHAKLINEGQAILKYINMQNGKDAQSKSFECMVDGHKAIAINGSGNSALFDSVWDESKYDLMFMFYLNSKRQWAISFYTTKDDVDCSEIAKKYGGGGHKKAAGCTIKDIPSFFAEFKIINQKEFGNG